MGVKEIENIDQPNSLLTPVKLETPGLIVILGATATGKTGLAISLATQLGLPIICADSRQVYRGMDIGTAKPSLEERVGIDHFLIDLVNPDQGFSLAEYQLEAQNLIDRFHQQSITPILVGGTGMYIKSIIHGMKIPRVSAQPQLRSQLQDLGQVYCHQLLAQVDPDTLIHPNDQYRTLRALEVFYVTGKPLSQLQAENPPSYPILQIGLETPANHRQLVSDRIEKMLDQGWLTEIESLQNKYGEENALLKTLGYGEMSDYLSDRTTLNEAKTKTITHTMQFAKQQRTWFRNTGSQRYKIHWRDRSNLEIESLLDLIHDRENWQVHSNDNRTNHSTQKQDH
jgi:tRNA dimethylallyltransferase